jgi:uncharacterized protein
VIRPPRNSTEDQIVGFDEVCQRLAGFDDRLGTEWVDGFLAAAAAGPLALPLEAVLQRMCDEAFDRAFADPPDRAHAIEQLGVRYAVLRDQLDAESLLAEPDLLRLQPLVLHWSAELREEAIAEDGLDAEEAAQLVTGAVWAIGFLDGVDAFADEWPDVPDEGSAAEFGELIEQVAILAHEPQGDEWREHMSRHHPKGEPDRDKLFDEACFAVQDMRLFWLDHAPRPSTRRVPAVPGRNDLCPCGSGKKYKKCHGGQ